MLKIGGSKLDAGNMIFIAVDEDDLSSLECG